MGYVFGYGVGPLSWSPMSEIVLTHFLYYLYGGTKAGECMCSPSLAASHSVS